jgi:hypothetical protein
MTDDFVDSWALVACICYCILWYVNMRISLLCLVTSDSSYVPKFFHSVYYKERFLKGPVFLFDSYIYMYTHRHLSVNMFP